MVKGREPARILIAIGNKKENRRHLQSAPRGVVQYNFYINGQLYKRATRRPDVRPHVSVFVVLRPRLPQSMGAVKALTADGLFIGQSPRSLNYYKIWRRTRTTPKAIRKGRGCGG